MHGLPSKHDLYHLIKVYVLVPPYKSICSVSTFLPMTNLLISESTVCHMLNLCCFGWQKCQIMWKKNNDKWYYKSWNLIYILLDQVMLFISQDTYFKVITEKLNEEKARFI